MRRSAPFICVLSDILIWGMMQEPNFNATCEKTLRFNKQLKICSTPLVVVIGIFTCMFIFFPLSPEMKKIRPSARPRHVLHCMLSLSILLTYVEAKKWQKSTNYWCFNGYFERKSKNLRRSAPFICVL